MNPRGLQVSYPSYHVREKITENRKAVVRSR